LFDAFNWPQYSFTTTGALDEATGVVTSDLSTLLTDFTHINAVYIENTSRPLPFLPGNINPYTITGTTPRYIERVSTATKFFRVWPLASTGNVIIRGKTKPTEFISTDTVVFDHHVLVLGAVADYLISDGTNIEDAQKFSKLYQNRVKSLAKELDGDVVLNTFNTSIPNEWV